MIAADQAALRLSSLSPEEITAVISGRCDQAHLLDGLARAEALEFNARLVTALQELGIWPRRHSERISAFGPIEAGGDG